MEEELREIIRGWMLLQRMMHYYPREEHYADSTESPWVRLSDSTDPMPIIE